MQKVLFLAMSALSLRSVGAFTQIARSSSRVQSIRCMHRLNKPAAIPRLIGCSATHQVSCYHRTTSLNMLMLSRGFSANTVDSKQSKTAMQQSADDDDDAFMPEFTKGDQIMVEVIYFGPLGASVDVVSHKSHNTLDCITQDEPALGRGMILQKELDYFRRGRGGVDIVKYEILPAWVEKVREDEFQDEDGESELRLDVSLRPVGMRNKAEQLAELVLQKLKDSPDGVLTVGDKSSPAEIGEVFPGASKNAFKQAVSKLYASGLVTPSPKSVTLNN